MASLPPLFVELKANVSEFTSKMDEAGGRVEKLRRDGSGHFDQLATVGKAAFLGLGAAAIAFGVSAVKVGIDQEEANARLTTALHNTGSAMTAMSEPVEQAESRMRRLGFTNGDTTDSLTVLTNATHNPTKALGDLSLAADIARARHIDLSTATDILAKVETGHVALLGRLGINTKDATGATISQEEAVKRLSAMYGGQASAYSQTFAGRMAELKAQVENVQEQVGLWLIPKIEALVRVGAGAIDWAEKNKTAAEALAVVIGGPLVVAMAAYIVQQGILVATKIAEFLASAASAATTAALAIAAAADAVYAALGPVGLLFAAVSGLAIAFDRSGTQARTAADAYAQSYIKQSAGAADQVAQLKAKVDELTAANKAQVESIHEKTGENLHDSAAMAKTKQQYQDNAEKVKQLKAEIERLTGAAKGEKDAQVDVAKATGDAGEAADATTKNVADLAEQTGLTTDRVDALAKKLGIDLTKAGADSAEKIASLNDRLKFTNPTALDLSVAMQTLADKTADAKEKASAFKTALDLLIGGNIDAERATVNFYNSIDQLGAKILANKADFDVHTKAGRENISMVEDSVSAIRNHVEAMKNQGFTADQIQAAFAGDTEALRKQLEQAGLTKDQIDKLLQSYNLVPGALNTVITADTGLAQQALDALIAKIKSAMSTTKDWYTAGAGYGISITPGMAIQRRASGGPVGPGDYVVGEEGPEFMHIGPDGRGYVRNASATKRMYAGSSTRSAGNGGSGGTTIIVQPGAVVVQGSVTSERDLVDAIHGGLLSKQQRQPLGFTS